MDPGEQGGMKVLTVVSFLVSTVAVGLLVLLVLETGALRERVQRLEARPAPTAPPTPGELLEAARPELVRLAQELRAPPPAAPEGLAPLETRLDVLETRLEATEQQTRSARSLLLSGRLETGESVDQFLERRLAEHRLGGARDRPWDDETDREERSKRSFEDLATALALDQVQQDEVRRILDDLKRRSFQLLSTTRVDGGSFVEDVTALFLTGGEPEQPQLQELFSRIMKEPLPGSDETFGSALVTLNLDAATRIKQHLQPEQATVLDGFAIDLGDIDTGFDPFETHVRQRLGLPPGEEQPR
jgi:hypothetical protein